MEIRDVVELAIDLYFDPRSEGNISDSFEEVMENGMRCYSELHTADLWKEAQKTIPEEGIMLAIVGYTDSTNVTGSGSQSAYPFVIFLGNHHEVAFHSSLLCGFL